MNESKENMKVNLHILGLLYISQFRNKSSLMQSLTKHFTYLEENQKQGSFYQSTCLLCKNEF